MAGADRGPFESHSIPDGYRRYLQPTIFEPWATRLIDYVGLEAGQVVLDVASGTGAVARAAARAVGQGGRVIASDISLGMLANVLDGAAPDAAPIDTMVSSATDLALPDASVDVVLCQQGLPFIPDRVAAARAMRRVLRPGGRIGVAVWITGRRLEPFDTYAEVLRAERVDAPFARPSDNTKLSMSVDEVDSALSQGGFVEVGTETRELVQDWPSVGAAVAGISGTPYWPAVAALDDERKTRFFAALARAMTDPDGRPVRRSAIAVLGRGTAA